MELHEILKQLDFEEIIENYKADEPNRLRKVAADLEEKYRQSEQSRKALEEKLKAGEGGTKEPLKGRITDKIVDVLSIKVTNYKWEAPFLVGLLTIFLGTGRFYGGKYAYNHAADSYKAYSHQRHQKKTEKKMGNTSIDYLFEFGKKGTGKGEFGDCGPSGIAIDGQRVYVSDFDNSRIQVFDLDGNYISEFGKERLHQPGSLALHDNKIYVISGKKIKIFNSNGDYITEFGKSGKGKGEFAAPEAITIQDDRIYLVDGDNHTVQIFDLSGKYLFQFGRKGEEGSGLYGPSDISIHNNKIYVAENLNSRIQIFDLDGKYISIFGKENVKFNRPLDIAVDKNRIFVTEDWEERVQVLDLDGNYITEFGKGGDKKGEFSFTSGIAVRDDRIYVADFCNSRVQVLQIKD